MVGLMRDEPCRTIHIRRPRPSEAGAAATVSTWFLSGRLPGLLLCSFALAGCSGGTASDRTEVLPPLPLNGSWHRVQTGDTLAALANRYAVPVEDIEEINGLESGAAPEVGRQLFIPRTGSGGPATRRPDRTKSAFSFKSNNTSSSGETGKKSEKDLAPVKLVWPVPGGQLASPFGTRDGRVHEGIDIAAPQGTAVVAAADGEVIYAGSGVRGYGNLIILRHGQGLVTVYAHNHRNHVSEGVEVRQGQVIGEVGSSGRTSGVHLHFEVRRGDSPLDPQRLVTP